MSPVSCTGPGCGDIGYILYIISVFPTDEKTETVTFWPDAVFNLFSGTRGKKKNQPRGGISVQENAAGLWYNDIRRSSAEEHNG